jgi:uncharacterized protein HemX
MHFSEDDLRKALKRHDPGPGFTNRVMTGINQAEKKAHAGPKRGSFFSAIISLARRPALAAGLAVLALAVGGGLGYWQHQVNERKRQHEQAMAKEAERQAIVALRITNAKLSHVFQRVRESQQNDSNIRRQRL